jgi:hypothetical protein
MDNKLVEAIRLYQKNPVWFVTDIIGAEPLGYQAEILNSVKDNPRTSVRSGHGVGKTTVEAWTILWFLTCFPYAKIPCTAPTEHQLKDILWSEISKWIHNSPLKSDIIWTAEKIFMRGYRADWFAVARTARKPDALQGFHGQNLLFVIDEGSGVDDFLFEPVLGALTEDNARLLICGNPTNISGFFAESHTSQSHLYNAIHIDARNSERVSKESVQLIIDMFGEDSDPFRVRVAGDFPKAMPDSFIHQDWIERNYIDAFEFKPFNIMDIGVDVARYGDDKTEIYGIADRMFGAKMETISKFDTMQVTGKVVNRIKQFNEKNPSVRVRVKVDCDGLGVGVYDRLREINKSGEIRCELFECHFGGRGGKLREGDPIGFENSTGLFWGAVRQALYDDQLKLAKDTELGSQLRNRRYSLNSDGKIVLERKDDMKKRKVHSPDRADALVLAYYAPSGGARIGVI